MERSAGSTSRYIKQLKFFNQVLVLGFFGVILQMLFVWQFIGIESLTFLIVPFASVVSYYLNSIGKFNLSKVFFINLVYLTGIITTFLLGGAAYYHLGVFSTFTFGLILFDRKREFLEIIIGVLAVLFVVFIAEYPIFDVPNFSDHPNNEVFKWVNIISLFVINSVLTIFILNINSDNEKDLFEAVSQKEMALNKLRNSADELESRKNNLETLVINRTYEISSQKDALEVQNKEKEVLLQEVHHRVKNNLQIIISLINLQLSKIDQEEVEIALKEIQTRVYAMSLVHRKMYETNNFTEIKLKDYTDQLVDNNRLLHPQLRFSFINDFPVEMKISMEQAIPLGLIFNEIVINYFKHGFIEEQEVNTLHFYIEEVEDEKIKIYCEDNGNGFKQIKSVEELESLGLQIIDGLTGQLDGVFSYYNKEGAVYEILISYANSNK